MNSSNIFIEDNTITLPVLKNGVTRIGDLWDSNRSVIVGENLFNQNLDGEYVDVSPIETVDYKLIHSRSTSEEMKTVKVGGEISLELLGGLIAVKGGADYKNDEKKSSKVEKLICYYERETYSVSAKPNAKQVMNQEIMGKIQRKELRATHLVRTVILGAEVRADIQISSSDKKSFSDVSGDFLGKLTYGPISASIKAKLGFLDSSENTDLYKEINIHSKPAMKTEPKSIKEMFRMIVNISTVVRDEKHYPKSGENVIGVPIRFLLVPIKQFLDFDIEKLYIKMTEKVMHDFNEMLVKIHDYRVPDYISRLVLNQIPELSIILNDELSVLSSEIREYEKGLRDVCVDYFEKSINTFKEYKVGKTHVEALLEIINQFESKCNSTEIRKKIIGFSVEGEAQLRSIHSVDIQDSKQSVEVLTNQNKLKNFIIGDKEIKILLHTDHESPEGVFLRFYEMAKPLSKLDCRLGVAIQAISPKFELIIKVNGRKDHYNVKEEIPHILSIIAASVGVGSDNERLFHSLYAEYLNTRLPFKTSDELSDINNLIRNSRLKNSKNLTIAKSHLETFYLLTRTDGRLKFFMPIDIIQTSFQAIRNIPILISSISSKNIDWIAGNLNIADKGEAGFLYIIKDTKLLAVCLDDYDLVLLRERFDENDLNCLKFLSPEQLNHSFYSERVETSLLIIKTIESHAYKSINFSSFGMKSFQEIPDQNVLKALQLISTLKSRTIVHFIGTLSKFALNERKELKNCLLRAGYSIPDSSFNQNILNDEYSKQLIIKGAIDVLESTDPLAEKINIAINIIKGSDTISEEKQVEYSSQVNTALDNLMNDKNCPKPLINKIKNFDRMELKIKYPQVVKLLKQYENENEDNGFHLKSLLSILNNESDSNVNNVLLSYINRIYVDENVFGPIKTKLIEELNKKHFFQLVAYLTRVSHGIKYFIIHKGVKDLCDSKDKVSALDRLLTQLSDKNIFNENQWQDLWKNNRFLIIIRSLIENHIIASKLLYLGCETSVPSYVPEDIAVKINETRVEYIDMPLPDIIKDFDEFHKILKEMRRKDNIPEKFRTVLADSIINNTELKIRLNDFGIMEKWKWNGNIFTEAIEMSSIESIIDRINEWKHSLEDQKMEQQYEPIKENHLANNLNDRESPEKILIRKPLSANWVMPKGLVNVLGDRANIIDSEESISMNPITQIPLPSDDLKQTVIQVMPYIKEDHFAIDFDDRDWVMPKDLKDENFMRSKDVKELQGFLDTSDQIFAVKESIESTFKEHSEKMKPFLNDSANKINKQEVNREEVIEELKIIFNGIPYTCPSQSSCNFCDNFLKIQRDLYSNVMGKSNELDVITTIQKYISKIREYYIKHLSQKLSAVAFRQIKSDENFSKIEKRLKKELTIKSEFNEFDIKNITTGILDELERDANENVTQISVTDQIYEEIVNVYQLTPTSLREIRSLRINSLEKIPAINLIYLQRFGNVTYKFMDKTCEYLLPAKSYELEGKLKSIGNDILNNEKVDTYRKGMIKKLRKSIESIFNDLEEKENIQLQSKFKWKVNIFAIQAFIKNMNEKQENWNKENNPFTILQNNKEKYSKWIGDKLRYGFDYYSDGSEAGVNLLQAIVQKALKTANDKREQEFKNQNWISRSAKIRLKYLSELVEEIKDGKLDNALRFFDSPQACISEWYRKRLESCLSVKELHEIFKETQEKLFDEVVIKLKELSTIEEKQKYITDFVKECDGIELRFTVIQTESTRDDSEIFSKGIFEAFEREKNQMFANNNIDFVDLTRDSSLLSKLGCTMSCPYCSAICWMPYGHDSDTSTSKKHHTCHQPMGLIGMHYYETKELVVDSCHNQSHNNWSWIVNDKSVSFWQKIKYNGYENEWKFETHTENRFNQLMMWFFLKLHHEIANRKGLSPAKHSELCHYNMLQLEEQIDAIMLSVNNCVYRKN